MVEYDFITDPDTYRIFDLVVWCLRRFFDVDEEASVQLVNAYHKKYAGCLMDDDYHHLGAYETATGIYYVMVLPEPKEEYAEWRRRNGHNMPPEEYFVQMRAYLAI